MISSLLLTLLAGLFIMLGGVFVLLFKNQKNIHSFSIGLSIGVLMFLLAIDLIPEAYELLESNFGNIGAIVILVLVSILGILIIKLMDHFMPEHHHGHKDNTHVAEMTSLALFIHNIVEGMALFVSCMLDIKVGLFLVLGVSMHNLVLGLSVSSEYFSHSKNTKKMFIMLLLLALSTFIGGVIMAIFNVYLENNFILGIILSLTVGMIIYIVFFELIPHFITLKSKKHSLFGLILGILLMILTMFIE